MASAGRSGADAEGVLASDDLLTAISENIVKGAPSLPHQVQPASIDLTLGPTATRVRAAFLPGKGRSVAERLTDGLGLHTLDLRGEGAVLEKGCVYVVPLAERLRLPRGMRARANPKSSTGRIDVFIRLVTEGGTAYEAVPEGYEGPLFAEISPRTFSILVREGSRLNQLRLRRGTAALSDGETAALHDAHPLFRHGSGRIEGGLHLSVDLSRDLGTIAGWRARRHTALIDVDRTDALDPAAFFDPILAPEDGRLVLDPDEFYILAGREELMIPEHLAAEMVAIDTDLGAFRVHYAGFFDPGFGLEAGSRAVLEVRGYDAPFLIEHGQTVARLTYERLTAPPRDLYGSGLASHYQGQGLRLSKHFRQG